MLSYLQGIDFSYASFFTIMIQLFACLLLNAFSLWNLGKAALGKRTQESIDP